jgi:hypothetical protein
MMTTPQQITQLVNAALEIDSQDARDAGALGFMARSLIQATMPHSKPKELIFHRENGNFTLTMFGNPKVGLPYGALPRLLMAWITTEALRTQKRRILLGSNLSDFMRELDIVPTGGRWGSITRLKDQIRRLFSCNISCTYDKEDEKGNEMAAGANLNIADNYALWWNPKDPNQTVLFESEVELSEKFFNEIINRPVPLDIRALKVLSRSPMALDIYSWLTYRMSYLKKPTTISWEALQLQFGAEYKERKTFKYNFIKQLKAVMLEYSEAKVSNEASGLLLQPSHTHIHKLC